MPTQWGFPGLEKNVLELDGTTNGGPGGVRSHGALSEADYESAAIKLAAPSLMNGCDAHRSETHRLMYVTHRRCRSYTLRRASNRGTLPIRDVYDTSLSDEIIDIGTDRCQSYPSPYPR